MKKEFKYLLAGAGIAAAGVLAYALLTERASEEAAAQPSENTAASGASYTRRSGQEYVAHRRQLLRKRAARPDDEGAGNGPGK